MHDLVVFLQIYLSTTLLFKVAVLLTESLSAEFLWDSTNGDDNAE